MHRNITAKLEVAFIVSVLQATAYFVQFLPLRGVRVLIGGLHAACVEITADRAEEFWTARRGHQLDDPTSHFAILRLQPTGLDLDLLKAGTAAVPTERAIHHRPHIE